MAAKERYGRHACVYHVRVVDGCGVEKRRRIGAVGGELRVHHRGIGTTPLGGRRRRCCSGCGGHLVRRHRRIDDRRVRFQIAAIVRSANTRTRSQSGLISSHGMRARESERAVLVGFGELAALGVAVGGEGRRRRVVGRAGAVLGHVRAVAHRDVQRAGAVPWETNPTTEGVMSDTTRHDTRAQCTHGTRACFAYLGPWVGMAGRWAGWGSMHTRLGQSGASDRHRRRQRPG
jgi:hypothetical protein